MKVALTKIALALLLAAQVTPARAQSAQEPARQDAPQAGRQEGVRPRGRGAGENLMRRLNLTPEQRERLREIRAQSDGAARDLTRRVRLARRALDEAIYADSSDESKIEHHAQLLLDAQGELLRLRVATELKVRRVLTPVQLQTFRELRRQAQRGQALRRRRRGAEPPVAPDGGNN